MKHRSTTLCAMLSALSLFAAGNAYAQRSAHKILRTAKNASWYVRVSTPVDSAEGFVAGVFRDTVHLSEEALYIPDVVRVDRRVRDDWRSVWSAAPSGAERVVGDTAIIAGNSLFIYAGTTALLLPGIFFLLPPPIIAGVELGVRNAAGDFNLSARTLAYPLPLVVGVVDVGRNFRSNGRRYSGFAIGGIFPTEDNFTVYPLVSMRAGVLPKTRGGARFELRSDAFFGDGGAAIIASLHLGFDMVFSH